MRRPQTRSLYSLDSSSNEIGEKNNTQRNLKSIKKNPKKVETFDDDISDKNVSKAETVEDDSSDEDSLNEHVSQNRLSKKANNIKSVTKNTQKTVANKMIKDVRAAIEAGYNKMAYNQSICAAIEEYNRRAHNNAKNDPLFFEIFFKTILGFNKLSSFELDTLVKEIKDSKNSILSTNDEEQDIIAYVCHTIYGFEPRIISLLSQIYSHLGFHYFDRFYNQRAQRVYLAKLNTKYNHLEDINELFPSPISRLKEKLKDISTSFNTLDSSTYPSDSRLNEREESSTLSLIMQNQTEEEQSDNNVSSASSSKKRKRKIKDDSVSQQSPSKRAKKDT